MLIRVVSVIALVGAATISIGAAQTIGPGGGPIAPGPSQPRDFTPGGIGPGGGPVAPGPAARGVNIERIGPGGGRLAPGPAHQRRARGGRRHGRQRRQRTEPQSVDDGRAVLGRHQHHNQVEALQEAWQPEGERGAVS